MSEVETALLGAPALHLPPVLPCPGADFLRRRSLSESLFHPATDVFGITDNAVFVHERGPSEIQDFNGWNESRVPLLPKPLPSSNAPSPDCGGVAS
jgi:hypothetical protein